MFIRSTSSFFYCNNIRKKSPYQSTGFTMQKQYLLHQPSVT
ncbi:hypothetical protein HMPREF0367_01242 [[Eubacterium] cylindroides ATCC 27803]|uniref:Uncharacterized protein n=1 Tax=Faecalitalea cylindroides ATCC 27803 TaxID=649755 RepID=U2PLI9_9FIRM|nr:hypothetical protein HMPREF0367_01242 [[Eubacterium] cylindroides ATCC 27803] [Faecalitalea cylindroides ATCC 27803]